MKKGEDHRGWRRTPQDAVDQRGHVLRHTPRPIGASSSIRAGGGWTAIGGQFVLIEQNEVHRVLSNLLPGAAQPSALGLVVRVRRMDVASAPLVGQIKAIQQVPDTRHTHFLEPRHRLPDASEPPAAAGKPKALRTLMQRLCQLGYGHIHLSRSVHSLSCSIVVFRTWQRTPCTPALALAAHL